MALTTPIDEGAPVYSGPISESPSGQINLPGSNYSTAMELAFIGSDDLWDWPKIFFDQSTIHNATVVRAIRGLPGDQHLVIYNPLGYHNIEPSKILQDILVHQAHVSHGLMRMYPNGDGTTTQWDRVIGANPHYTYIDEDTIIKDDVDWIETTTDGAEEDVTIYNEAPSNLASIKEIMVNCWQSLRRGSDEGMAIKVMLLASSVVKGTVYLTSQVGTLSSTYSQFVQRKIPALNLSTSEANALQLKIYAYRDTAGGLPDPRWRVFNMDLHVWYETTDISLIDESSFEALHSYFSGQATPYLLDGDLYGLTFRQAILKILNHAPEIFLYLGYDGKLRLKKIPKHSDETSPYSISVENGFRKIVRTWDYKDREFQRLAIKYNATNPHIGQASAESNPDNDLNDKETPLWNSSQRYAWNASELEIEREFINDDDVIFTFKQNYLNIYGQDAISAIEVEVDHRIFRVEIGDTISLDIPQFGLSAKKMLVVARKINLDNMTGRLILYDIEFTI